ncbi:MAG: PAS domain-containing protein, partial [Ilumatobacteraceae bacterium]
MRIDPVVAVSVAIAAAVALIGLVVSLRSAHRSLAERDGVEDVARSARALLDDLDEAVVHVDAGGRVREANRAAARLIGVGLARRGGSRVDDGTVAAARGLL